MVTEKLLQCGVVSRLFSTTNYSSTSSMVNIPLHTEKPTTTTTHKYKNDYFSAVRSWTRKEQEEEEEESLCNRIIRQFVRKGYHSPKAPISIICDQWVQQGRRIDRAEVWLLVKQLRSLKRYKHALEFFNNTPEKLQTFKVYGALLNCYAHEKSLEKAETTLQKMRELGIARTRLVFTVMMNLYFRMGKHEKVDILAQEMEEKGIACDKCSYTVILKAYAADSKTAAMEKLLMKMEADPCITMDSYLYAAAANGYIIGGQMDKALVTSRKSENLIKFQASRFACGSLLTMYSRLAKKDEVYRAWDLLKKAGKLYNDTYHHMMCSLAKLDDIDGLEKIFEDWEANKKSFDFRIPNLLVSTYCEKGLLEKAESVLNKLIKSRKKLKAYTWERLAKEYQRYEHMDKAVDAMKKAILATGSRYQPNLDVLTGCIDYLKGKGDDKLAEFVALLKEHGHSINDIHDESEKHIDCGYPGLSTGEQMGRKTSFLFSWVSRMMKFLKTKVLKQVMS